MFYSFRLSNTNWPTWLVTLRYFLTQNQIRWTIIAFEAARLLVYNAARLKEANLSYIKEAAMAKLVASNVATKVTSKCVELLGGVRFPLLYWIFAIKLVDSGWLHQRVSGREVL
jgi:alkylation response protein AidB-like acyl-CoA dehydrogenase